MDQEKDAGIPVLRGIHRHPHQDQVVYGEAAGEALTAIAGAYGVRRLAVITTRSLSGSSGLATRLIHRLGDLCVGGFDGVAAHSPREGVVAGAAWARKSKADLLVAVGGGSVIDATKAMQLCLWANLREISEMDRYHVNAGPGRVDWSRIEPTVRMVAVPTTLSAAEFTITATLANHQKGSKENFAHPLLIPRAVVLDPAMALETPDALWFSTGIKAIDHSVEQLCTPTRAPFADAVAAEGLRWLAKGLPAAKAYPRDPGARQQCQFGMWLAISGATAGRGRGASHAIGHTLGAAFGVPHGMTSCITLPAVLRWNADIDAVRQQYVLRLMESSALSASEAIRGLCETFGLLTDLQSVGIGPDLYQAIAEHTMHDTGTKSNPRPINGPDDVVDILRLAERGVPVGR